MLRIKRILSIILMVLLSGCISDLIDSRSTTNTPEEVEESIAGTQRVIAELELGEYLLEDRILAEITSYITFPGTDITNQYELAYCGVDCAARTWFGSPDSNVDNLTVAVIRHRSISRAETYMVAFEQAYFQDFFLNVTPIYPDFAQEVKDGVSSDFSEYYTVARYDDISVEVILNLLDPLPNDVLRRGAIVMVELIARRQIETLIPQVDSSG